MSVRQCVACISDKGMQQQQQLPAFSRPRLFRVFVQNMHLSQPLNCEQSKIHLRVFRIGERGLLCPEGLSVHVLVQWVCVACFAHSFALFSFH